MNILHNMHLILKIYPLLIIKILDPLFLLWNTHISIKVNKKIKMLMVILLKYPSIKYRLRKYYQNIRILVLKIIYKKHNKMVSYLKLLVIIIIIPILLMHIKDHSIIKNFLMISILLAFKEKKLHDLLYIYFFVFLAVVFLCSIFSLSIFYWAKYK
jgi:hypothetical protein